MQKIIKQIYADKISGWSLSINLFLLMVNLVVIAFFYHLLPTYIPLYNKRSWGYERLGNTYEIFLPVFLMLACVFINTILGLKMQQKIPLLARFLFVTSCGASIFTTFFILKIISEIV